MSTIAILSTRLYGQDGVSVEARKWERASGLDRVHTSDITRPLVVADAAWRLFQGRR